MRKYLAAATSQSFLVAILEPAVAAAQGLGVTGGGNVGTGASVGTRGSVGAGASVGGQGTAGGTGASVGTKGSVDAGASVGDANDIGTGVGQQTGTGDAAATTAREGLVLPRILLPRGGQHSVDVPAIKAIPGTPIAVVRACSEAIEVAAKPYGMESVRAKSAGSLRRLRRGAVSAPIAVRIHYARQGGDEIRQARIKCHLDATGKVIRLT